MTTTLQNTPGPVRQRALAPDLTRGLMLLFIALANAANVAFAGQPGVDPTPHGPARILNFLLVDFVDSRAYPVFALMFGYGIVQIARRQGDGARGALLRRNGMLFVFGLAHATLLYFGDFLGAYGIIGILVTLLLLRRSDRFHRIVLWLWGLQTAELVVVAIVAIAGAHGGAAHLVNSPNPSLAASTYLGSMLDRLQEWPLHTASVVPMIVYVWLGVWAARHRILEEPAKHLRLLRVTAVVGLGTVVLGGLPYALVAAGALHVDASSVGSFAYLHAVSGAYGGPGYIALIALVAMRLKRTGTVEAISALGQRSMSGYLMQSVAWMVIFAPWALGLGRGSTLVAVGVAVAVWVAEVWAASRMQAAGVRGLPESALRKIAYR